ncbi:2OG-Fe(II) oxygenase [[Pseudomonas] boreopolis]|uniref:2OG-Fe(II) oxygenase n=1 Tax=Xanthomonas boreopolis TaxID=86183 RepID=UPI003D9B1CB2
MDMQRIAIQHMPKLGEVEVFDDIVPADLRRRILALVRRPIWAYGWKSVKARDRFCFWHAHFAGGEESSREGCEAELAANVEAKPIHELWELLSSSILKGHEPLRVYANGHTYGVEGYVHTDSSDEENYFTSIYYAHADWEPDWAGETVFFSRESVDISKSVYPTPGRVILFRGATAHAARSPSRECPELRICIVIKSQLRRDAR